MTIANYRRLIRAVSFCLLMFVATAPAQTLSFPARHEHTVGGCDGTLVFDTAGVRYDAIKHAAKWTYDDIQELRVDDSGRVQLLSYDDAGKMKLGADRVYHFTLDGDPRPLAAMLAPRLERRFVSGSALKPEKVVAEFEVKHLKPIRGTEGTLTFGESEVSYRTEEKGESRTWQYADIETISSSDAFHLSLSTYERQKFHYATRRAFNFQLKRPLDEKIYNTIWRRINTGTGLEVFEKLRSDVSDKANSILETPVATSTAHDPGQGDFGSGIAAVGLPASQQLPSDSPPALDRGNHARNRSGEVRNRQPRDPRLATMQRVLAEEGLPPGFVGIAKVESAFNPLALSPKNARGLWQFIPETARRFGLRVDGAHDDRTDAERSTRAAARYLKELYAMFGDWRLAFAGYNAGEGRVEAARAAAQTSDFARIAAKLPRETRRYVPAVMAALDGPLVPPAAGWRAAEGRGYRIYAPVALLPRLTAAEVPVTQ